MTIATCRGTPRAESCFAHGLEREPIGSTTALAEMMASISKNEWGTIVASGGRNFAAPTFFSATPFCDSFLRLAISACECLIDHKSMRSYGAECDERARPHVPGLELFAVSKRRRTFHCDREILPCSSN